MKIIRKTAEIVARAHESEDGFMSGETAYLVSALPFTAAKDFLNRETIDKGIEAWNAERTTDKNVEEVAKERLEFAMDKASGHRGLSAGFAADYIRAIAWLTTDDEAFKKVEDAEYQNYGAPIAKAAAEVMGLTEQWSAHYANPRLERMADGLPCIEDGTGYYGGGCEEGCSR